MKKQGFTLVELAMVIALLGLLIGGGLQLYQLYSTHQHVQLTKTRMGQIHAAIERFVTENGRLPCPASYSAPPQTELYGREILEKDDSGCDSRGLESKGIFIKQGNEGRMIAIGTIPTRSLNLPDDMMLDAWDSRFTYAVTSDLTDQDTFWALYKYAKGALSLEDINGNSITAEKGTGLFVLISHGKERRGGYNRNGKPFPLACSTPYHVKEKPSSLERCDQGASGYECVPVEFENCNNDSVFVDSKEHGLQHNAFYYDDYVLYDVLLQGAERQAFQDKQILRGFARCALERKLYDMTTGDCVLAEVD